MKRCLPALAGLEVREGFRTRASLFDIHLIIILIKWMDRASMRSGQEKRAIVGHFSQNPTAKGTTPLIHSPHRRSNPGEGSLVEDLLIGVLRWLAGLMKEWMCVIPLQRWPSASGAVPPRPVARRLDFKGCMDDCPASRDRRFGGAGATGALLARALEKVARSPEIPLDADT